MSVTFHGPHIPPPQDRPTVPPSLHRKPSFRWRLRRWILKKLDAWPRERPEPRTEWGELRRAERERLVREVRRLRAFKNRVEADWPSLAARIRAEILEEDGRP